MIVGNSFFCKHVKKPTAGTCTICFSAESEPTMNMQDDNANKESSTVSMPVGDLPVLAVNQGSKDNTIDTVLREMTFTLTTKDDGKNPVVTATRVKLPAEAIQDIQTLLAKEVAKAVLGLFPEYDKVTNPGYTFMINKDELDSYLAAFTKKVVKHDG